MKVTAAFLMLIATLGSCQKGDTGAAGANGTNGTNGTNGNANVQSGTVAITASNWTWDASGSYYYCTVTDSSVTQDIVKSGAVEVFLQASGGNGWVAIPSSVTSSSTVSDYFNFDYALYEVEFILEFSNQAQASSIASYNYKVVCIAASQRKANPNTNWHDYESIKAAMGNNLIEKTITVKQ